jgi:hypothetical protein
LCGLSKILLNPTEILLILIPRKKTDSSRKNKPFIDNSMFFPCHNVSAFFRNRKKHPLSINPKNLQLNFRFWLKSTIFAQNIEIMEALHIDTQSLLRDADKMPVTELERFLKDINALLRRKRTQDKALRERQLLHKINNTVLDAAQTERYHVLVEKLELSTMTDAEHTELELLGNKEEKLRNQRVKYMIELAQLRAVSLTEVMASLGLKPLAHA